MQPSALDRNHAPRVLFLADHGPGTGLGHVARCLALARVLHDHGMRVTLAAPDIPQFLDAGPCHLLNCPSGEHDLLAWLRQADADVLVLDSYRLSDDWRRAVRALARVWLCLDDDRGQWIEGAALVLNSSPLALARAYARRAPGAKALLGPAYTLVGPAFRAEPDAWEGREPRVLVTFGGADPLALTEPTTQALLDRLPSNVLLDVVLPSQRVVHLPSHPRVHIHSRMPQLAGLMGRARLALTQIGGTLGELAAAGTPAVAAVTSKDQAAWLEPHPQLQWCRLVDGRVHAPLAGRMAEMAVALWQSAEQLQALSQLARHTVDGAGADRVAREIGGMLRRPEAQPGQPGH